MTSPDPNQRDAVLAAVDAALSDECVSAHTPDEREVQELALALAAQSRTPRPQFAEYLDLRVSEGFAPPESARPRRARKWGGRRLASARRVRFSPRVLAGCLAALVALAVSVSLLSGTRDPTNETGGAPLLSEPQDGSGDAPLVGELRDRPVGAPLSEELQLAPEGATATSDEQSNAPGGGIASDQRERRIERSATLELAAPDGRLEEVGADIIAIADRRRGFVLSSSLSTGAGSEAGGTFELRIPARDLQPALRDLSELGTVRARTQSGDDVTPAFVSLEDRLEAARADRRGLLRRLERAGGVGQARALRRRLDTVATEINTLRAELRALRERTTYAALTVSLMGGEEAGSGAGSKTGEAFDDAVGSLVGASALALRAVGVLIPLALLGGLAWLVTALARRRRREAALV